jgi:hypothetical protein
LNRLQHRLLLPLAARLTLPPAAHATPPPTAPTATITPDQPLPLNGPWRFTLGDSPTDPATHQPLWSLPSFNDTAWQPYLLDPQHPNLTAFQAAQSPELPGFQSHGHPAYTGYSWYRITLQPPPNAHSLSLLIPQYIDDDYDLFLNGQKLGHFGHLDRWHFTYPSQPMLFPLPDSALHSAQPITIALRFWNIPSEADQVFENLAGGLRGVPLLGPSEPLQIFLHSAQQSAPQLSWRRISLAASLGIVGILSLFLFRFNRRQREYLWAGINLTCFAIGEAVFSAAAAPQTSLPQQFAIFIVLATALVALFALPLAAMYLLSVPRPLWRRLNVAACALLAAQYFGTVIWQIGLIPSSPALDRFLSATLLGTVPFLLLLVAITIDGLRTLGRKAWLLLTPGMFFALYLVLFFAFTPRFITIASLALFCVPLSVLIVFLLRFTRQQRENARLVDDMRQAAEIQQVLIPEHLPPTPNLTIHTEYRPAREVGGDFFQIIPHPSDGSDLANSVLVVAGDVTGKGLQAGMLVSLLVGAIRTAADVSSDPLLILQTLNRRLLGRGHAQATALALLIAPDGHATLANAGHIPPYLNGQPLDMEGALPLGMIPDADFSVMHFHLAPNDNLVLISDGILEATDPHGQLFGFDRVQQLLRDNLSPSALADAAQLFGQEDDISLISLTRNPHPS